jgi:exodeoxyribonuclease V alpha subunit
MSASESTPVPVVRDPLDARRAREAPGVLRAFNDIGVLSAADVHVAVRLGRLARDEDDGVLLAAALAVRGPRLGHVYVDLATIRQTATVDTEEPVDLTGLPWPEPAAWVAGLARSPLVAVGEDAADDGCPLRLVGSALYLDRYWREERAVAADLVGLGATAPEDASAALLADGVARLFAGRTEGRQALAAAAAVLSRFAVVAGGPGTGKTTTVAQIVALLAEQAEAAEGGDLMVALAAPTGKAAARLQEAVQGGAGALEVSAEVRAFLSSLEASTLHRLLGWRPGSHSRFRHHRGNRLPHDVVIVDETSMVSLSLMGRLVEAVRPEARLILVGDPGQLTSIEAGAVLGDIVGPTSDGLRIGAEARLRLGAAVGHEVDATDPPAGCVVGDGIVVLDRVHRYGGGIAELAEAIRRGDEGAVMEVLGGARDDVTWIAADVAGEAERDALAPVRARVVAAGRAIMDAAQAGDARAALEALATFRVLCAHRRGPYGVEAWMARIERWLAEAGSGGGGGPWYVGRPLIVTENDYGLRLYNGDTGVVIRTAAGHVTAAFERGGEVATIRPSRLGGVDTVHAMTVHKSQGSQFATAAVLIPPATSPILTRELLYTAVTRAQEHLILAGTEESVRAAVGRPVARASGLRGRLWGGSAP